MYILNRPSWNDYFLGLVKLIAARSPDANTKHAALICSPSHKIVSTGYNGFPPGLDDFLIPNTRPGKYDFMIHAEENAIINAKTDLTGHFIYVTGKPCPKCLRAVIATGITQVFYDSSRPSYADEEKDRPVFDRLVELSSIWIWPLKPDLGWMTECI